MKTRDLLDELKERKEYQKFKKENQKAFFCAGFFIFNLQEKTEQIQLDFFLPDKKRIAAFEWPIKEPKIFDDEIKEMQEQSLEIKIDIDDLEAIATKIIAKNKSRVSPTKIIAILRDNQWNLTCMDNFLGIVQIKLDAKTGEEISFDKGSLMDFMGIKKK